VTLLQHHGSITTEAEQQQVAEARTELQQQLSDIAATAVQQVKARAASAAARKQAAEGGQAKQQEQAAAAVLQSFVEQLQSVEDGCTDVAAAQQACKVKKPRSYARQGSGTSSGCQGTATLIVHTVYIQHSTCTRFGHQVLSCWSACRLAKCAVWPT
jgi:hypothetical protein